VRTPVYAQRDKSAKGQGFALFKGGKRKGKKNKSTTPNQRSLKKRAQRKKAIQVDHHDASRSGRVRRTKGEENLASINLAQDLAPEKPGWEDTLHRLAVEWRKSGEN